MANQSTIKLESFETLKQLVAQELQQVDEMILEYAKSHIELVPLISNYLTNAGGKRLRPILTLVCAKLFGKINEQAIKLATAVEFIHTATLLHDDVVDKSEKRRGKPTANNIWDNRACILVGDFLFSQAFKLMVETNNLTVLQLLSTASAKIAESEVWQLEMLEQFDISRETYFKLIEGKTAVLFAAACAAGGVVSGCSSEEKEKLYNFGLQLGISFQIVDDILDYTANSQFGKKLGNDFVEGKMTLPVIEACLSASEKDLQMLKNLIQSRHRDQSAFEKFKTMLETNGSIDSAYKFAKEANNFAVGEIASFDSKDIVNSLVNFSESLVYRNF